MPTRSACTADPTLFPVIVTTAPIDPYLPDLPPGTDEVNARILRAAQVHTGDVVVAHADQHTGHRSGLTETDTADPYQAVPYTVDGVVYLHPASRAYGVEPSTLLLVIPASTLLTEPPAPPPLVRHPSDAHYWYCPARLVRPGDVLYWWGEPVTVLTVARHPDRPLVMTLRDHQAGTVTIRTDQTVDICVPLIRPDVELVLPLLDQRAQPQRLTAGPSSPAARIAHSCGLLTSDTGTLTAEGQRWRRDAHAGTFRLASAVPQLPFGVLPQYDSTQPATRAEHVVLRLLAACRRPDEDLTAYRIGYDLTRYGPPPAVHHRAGSDAPASDAESSSLDMLVYEPPFADPQLAALRLGYADGMYGE